MSEAYLSISFAYDINVFIIGSNIDARCQQLNDDLEKKSSGYLAKKYH